MSTASPTGASTEAEMSPVLDITANARSGTKPGAESGAENLLATPPKTIRKVISKSPKAKSPKAGSPKTAAIGNLDSTQVLTPGDETQTFRLDDTHSQLHAPHSATVLQPDSGGQPDSAIEPTLDPSGTLVISPPVASSPLAGLVYVSAKRVIDVVLSSMMLLLLSPLLLLSAILVKFTDGGSIFYPHTRVGENGNEFTCYKFRSMVVNAEQMKANLAFFNSHDDQRTFKIPDDPRITWIGRWMRRTSVDELPQLWNVLKGEMSVVGPRPPVVTEVEQYTWDDMQRLAVKPGLTCIWQVSGRSRLPFPEQLRLDMEYIEKRSIALDLKLIVLTVPAVLSADGAY